MQEDVVYYRLVIEDPEAGKPLCFWSSGDARVTYNTTYAKISEDKKPKFTIERVELTILNRSTHL